MDQKYSDFGVLIADKSTFFRRGVADLLRGYFPSAQLWEADMFHIALEELHRTGVELVLLDLHLWGMNSLEGLRRLCSHYPDLRVVVLADTDDHTTILECLAAGAHGYVLKSASPSQFVHAIMAVLSDGIFAPASVRGGLSAPSAASPQLQMEAQPVMSVLTSRQQDVFRLLAEGCASKTIARRLGLGLGTVKVHLAAIYRVLGVRTRMEAIAKANVGGSLRVLLQEGEQPMARLH